MKNAISNSKKAINPNSCCFFFSKNCKDHHSHPPHNFFKLRKKKRNKEERKKYIRIFRVSCVASCCLLPGLLKKHETLQLLPLHPVHFTSSLCLCLCLSLCICALGLLCNDFSSLSTKQKQ